MSTLTTRVAALQIKAWHLLYRMKKIHDDQKRANKKRIPKNPRPRIIQALTTFYSLVDMIITMEHISVFLKETRVTKEIGATLEEQASKSIKQIQVAISKWIAVRHLLGGHIDLKNIEAACVQHNFRGVLLSDDLEPDIAVYNLLILEAAINGARQKSDIFGRDIDFEGRGIPDELQTIVDRINEDWAKAFKLFSKIIEHMYSIGKQEKIEATMPEQRTGLLIWD